MNRANRPMKIPPVQLRAAVPRGFPGSCEKLHSPVESFRVSVRWYEATVARRAIQNPEIVDRGTFSHENEVIASADRRRWRRPRRICRKCERTLNSEAWCGA